MRNLLFCLATLMSVVAIAQPGPELSRRAMLEFSTESIDGKFHVNQLEASSPAYKAGLRDRDLILAVNGKEVRADHIGQDILRRINGNEPAEFEVGRAGERLEFVFTPVPKPLEKFTGVVSTYGALRTPDGAVLRTLVTRPENARGPLPAIFFTQWVSCASVEIDRSVAWLDVMRGVIERSGMVFIRVERSGGGDSEGPGCYELDYDTEVAHYQHAFDQLVKAPLVDTSQVYIWGNSLGSTTAPLVAQNRNVAGIIVDGGGAQTYFERMLQFDRIGFEYSGMNPQEIDERMRRHAEFHVEYLLKGRDPDEIVEERQHLANVWTSMRGTGEGMHYGRPYAYHRQAARRSFLGAWADFKGEVLVLYHEYDQFANESGHALIAETLERLRPGSATFSILPAMGHDFRVYPSREHAVQWRDGVAAPEIAITDILGWLEARARYHEK